MSERDNRLQRVERTLQAVYRREEDSIAGPSEGDVWRIMLRVRAAARMRTGTAPGDVRFMWRFVSAGMVAAVVLLALALSDSAPDPVPANSVDDMAVAVMNPSLPF
jgi:cytochrome c-type biogenesis protein CcmH/NrfG